MVYQSWTYGISMLGRERSSAEPAYSDFGSVGFYEDFEQAYPKCFNAELYGFGVTFSARVSKEYPNPL